MTLLTLFGKGIQIKCKCGTNELWLIKIYEDREILKNIGIYAKTLLLNILIKRLMLQHKSKYLSLSFDNCNIKMSIMFLNTCTYINSFHISNRQGIIIKLSAFI